MNPLLIYEATTEHAYPEVEAWCIENIGLWNEDWYRVRHDIAAVAVGWNKQSYYFRRPEDRTMFMLRWA